ncbi:hypothetical protein [Reichenbachiella sp.]|uniref:hypothetical protein n=1 Tax=Reichenbachiella sp. TaxID=2184521 RepID=UPI003BB19F5C
MTIIEAGKRSLIKIFEFTDEFNQFHKSSRGLNKLFSSKERFIEISERPLILNINKRTSLTQKILRSYDISIVEQRKKEYSREVNFYKEEIHGPRTYNPTPRQIEYLEFQKNEIQKLIDLCEQRITNLKIPILSNILRVDSNDYFNCLKNGVLIKNDGTWNKSLLATIAYYTKFKNWIEIPYDKDQLAEIYYKHFFIEKENQRFQIFKRRKFDEFTSEEIENMELIFAPLLQAKLL